jgi:hypothetical protein
MNIEMILFFLVVPQSPYLIRLTEQYGDIGGEYVIENEDYKFM